MARSTNNLSIPDLIASIEVIKRVQPPVKRRAEQRRDKRRRNKRFAASAEYRGKECGCKGKCPCSSVTNVVRDARRVAGFADDWDTTSLDDTLTTDEVEQLETALEEPARVIPELVAAVKQPLPADDMPAWERELLYGTVAKMPKLFIDRRKVVPKKPITLPKHLRCPEDEERPARRAHGGR